MFLLGGYLFLTFEITFIEYFLINYEKYTRYATSTFLFTKGKHMSKYQENLLAFRIECNFGVYFNLEHFKGFA